MYEELVKSLREATGWKNASIHYSLMNEAAKAIEVLNVECKEWKERGDALEKTLNVAFSDFAKIMENQFYLQTDMTKEET